MTRPQPVFLLALWCCLAITGRGVEAARKQTCLVLAEGYVSEYAWCKYQEMQFPWDHPGHAYCLRGLLDNANRFHRWLAGWKVRRIDLEKHRGPLRLEGVDLVILDEVRQTVCEPHETALIEFVRGGGGLLVYAGFWGLGGCPKGEYNANVPVSSYQRSPLGAILPVEITTTPDLEMLADRPKPSRTPRFVDEAFGAGIEASEWEVFGLHGCKPRGQVQAELDGKPLIAARPFGQGRVVVYTGDDLAWIRAGAGSHLFRFSRMLWRRLANLAMGETSAIPAMADPEPEWEMEAAFAHPNQPMNFLWAGYFYYRTPDTERLWAKDLVTHSTTLFSGAPEVLGKAGVQSWESVGCPLMTKAAIEDASAWMIDSDGKPVPGHPCYNNPKALQNMEEATARWAEEVANRSWVTYGHMGDETEYGNCYCDHCQRLFRQDFGYGLPKLKNDFSADYLDRWIDYHLFKNESIGSMYARAAQAAHKRNPRLRMFASLPQGIGMCHGDDQLHTQSGFDLLWDHTYPGTMAIRVGLNASLLEETAFLQGRPSVPIFDLLQGFDYYDNAPHMPPREYVREMAWQAIAHGIDSVGWFVYNAFFWNMPGSEMWEEIGCLGREVLAPLTPTLYEMRNAPQPVGLLYSYSQEAVDGLKELTWDKAQPWQGVIRWWSQHATQEAYEVLKYAHVPFNVVSEHRLLLGRPLPWKVLIVPYVEHLHSKSRAALGAFIANGGGVYVGANSTLDLPGVKKLPMSFDTKFTTWWPAERKDEWNQRRVRVYMISAFLEKARQMRQLLSRFCDQAMVTIDDPEVVCNVREAGAAKYLFFVNDHQLNPVSEAYRKKRQQYNHFMLMPMEFPRAETTVGIKGSGYLYSLPMASNAPVEIEPDGRTRFRLKLQGGEGRAFLLLPEKVAAVELTSPPVKRTEGITLKARVLSRSGILKASLPLQIDFQCKGVRQTVYATTKSGVISWTAPFLKEFPAGPITVKLTDMGSGKRVQSQTR